MSNFLNSVYAGLSLYDCILFFCCALLTGLSKAGLKGLGLAIVPVMALIFGARTSTGILLPMLIIADIMAVIYYRKFAKWKYIIMLLPATAVGILIAFITGKLINEKQFGIILSTIVILMLILMVLNDLRQKRNSKIPDNIFFASIMGIVGGFATMIGNSAGPVLNIYFLTMKMPKKEFIGTAAWFFLIINIVKLPFHVFSWGTINSQSILVSLTSIPLIATGIFTGIWLVKLFPEKVYRYFVIIATIVSAVFLFIKN